jgi:beta-aspartyl-peptidase (threonine type)
MTASSPPFVLETGNLVGPALLVHGGAGTFERVRDQGGKAQLEGSLALALAAGWDVLERSGAALQAVVAAVASLEDGGLFNAGRGSTPTSEGATETDASVMDGGSRTAGAICAATWPANPVRAALAVANLSLNDAIIDQAASPSNVSGAAPGPPAAQTGTGAWHPLLLAGAGADRLAEAAGLAAMPASRATTGSAAITHHDSSPGTVGAVALDRAGHVAAATSTGGRGGQLPGRVGDSAIIGAGTWADDSTVALSATGAGEAFILAGFAHRVDWALRSGIELTDALATALDAVLRNDGSGGAIALTSAGRFATIFGTAAMARGWRNAHELVVRI